jgi:hypothetical protein
VLYAVVVLQGIRVFSWLTESCVDSEFPLGDDLWLLPPLIATHVAQMTSALAKASRARSIA